MSLLLKLHKPLYRGLFRWSGKFISDSVEIVFASSELIGKAAGVVTLIAIILAIVAPTIKIAIASFMASCLSAFAESMGTDEKIVKIISGFGSAYKTILGILISTSVTFIVAVATIISVIGKITS